MYRESKHGPLKASSHLLKGADQQPLKVTGSFTGKLSYNNTESCEEIFVIQGLQIPLVGRPANSSLNLVARVTLIQGDQETIIKQFPELFEDLGQTTGEYHIKLHKASHHTICSHDPQKNCHTSMTMSQRRITEKGKTWSHS